VPLAGKIVKGRYVDSIALMRIADETRRLPGVHSATLVLATAANRQALRDAALWPLASEAAGPDDLVIAIAGESEAAVRAALEQAEAALTPRPGAAGPAAIPAPRSVTGAVRRTPGANLAVIAVPGRYAVAEAQQALSAGLHAFIFSDAVALDDEARLKRRARGRGLLVMGPECGTAIVNGIGLGFANAVRRGPVGLVGASGTGLQEVTTLLHRLGTGVSHALGTGGRDLQASVGGVSTLQALALLGADPLTRVVVIVSKPADDAVAATVLQSAAGLGKPVVACLLGWRGKVPAEVRAVASLEEAAVAALTTLGLEPRALPEVEMTSPRSGGRSSVHGFYTGGTLCEEARALVGAAAGLFIDFGAAQYTEGRPHPMIDPERRDRAVAASGDDPTAEVLLLDVVLGQCAHPDPAGAAIAGIEEARARAKRHGRRLDVVAHVVGTEDDPQPLSAQESALREHDVIVCPSNRRAALLARKLARGSDAS
jgi:FdrA protein